MAKQSGYIKKQRARTEALCQWHRWFAVQQSKDMMLIAAHEAFGFGPERCKKLSEAFDQAFSDYADEVKVDAKDDKKDLWYSRNRVDEKLAEACGEYFVPWDVRYGGG